MKISLVKSGKRLDWGEACFNLQGGLLMKIPASTQYQPPSQHGSNSTDINKRNSGSDSYNNSNNSDTPQQDEAHLKCCLICQGRLSGTALQVVTAFF